MELKTQKGTYLALLEASLEKKSDILDCIYQLTKEQDLLFNDIKIDEEQFNRIIDDKDKQIQVLLQLDEGFDQTYQRVKDEITNHPGKYQNEIMRLKELITLVTNKSVQLQALEKRNKSKIEEYFRLRHKELKDLKMSNQMVSSYYKNITDQHQQSYFFDKKK